MIPDNLELKHLLDFAVQLAREAGDIADRHFKGSFVAERKADNSFVTIADREAERNLRASIERYCVTSGLAATIRSTAARMGSTCRCSSVEISTALTSGRASNSR